MRLAAVALNAAILCVLGSVALAGNPTPAPHFTIDLDSDATTRWQPIVSQFVDYYGPIAEYIDQFYPPDIQPLFDPILADLDYFIPAPYADEMRGVAAVLNGTAGLDLGKVVIMNLIYDLTAFCTSIVAQTTEGVMLHGRNLDYPLPGLQNITIAVDFQRGGQTIYSATTFAGFVGVLTGVRPQGWSLTVNQRDIGNIFDILKNIEEALEGAHSIGMFLRDTLESTATFDDAVEALQHQRLMGPVYLTVAGTQPGQGAIITRDREDPADVWWIAAPENWYRGQTNDDHWKPPKDDRRVAMNNAMRTFDMSNITLSAMYGVLSTPPVFNHITRYTTLMCPATGEMNTRVRFDAPTSEEDAQAGWKLQF
jgi:N-acylethanolamine-hydrolysing acid amidase